MSPSGVVYNCPCWVTEARTRAPWPATRGDRSARLQQRRIKSPGPPAPEQHATTGRAEPPVLDDAGIEGGVTGEQLPAVAAPTSWRPELRRRRRFDEGLRGVGESGMQAWDLGHDTPLLRSGEASGLCDEMAAHHPAKRGVPTKSFSREDTSIQEWPGSSILERDF